MLGERRAGAGGPPQGTGVQAGPGSGLTLGLGVAQPPTPLSTQGPALGVDPAACTRAKAWTVSCLNRSPLPTRSARICQRFNASPCPRTAQPFSWLDLTLIRG